MKWQKGKPIELEDFSQIEIDDFESGGFLFLAAKKAKTESCEYKQKMWENHYQIEFILADLNRCNGYAVNNSIEEFVEWMKIKTAK